MSSSQPQQRVRLPGLESLRQSVGERSSEVDGPAAATGRPGASGSSANPGPSGDSEPAVRILYMEDDAGLARLFQKRLQRLGYEIDLAGDGQEGLECFDRQKYDILAIDYKMPVCDGLEVISLLASRGRVPPTIMLTANGDEAVAVEALKLGASDYIVKDAAGGYIRLLPSVIERLLEKRRLEETRHNALDALRQSEERLRAVTQSASDAIISFDDKGRIILWNRHAESLFAYTLEEAQQLSISRILPERYQALVNQQLESLAGGSGAGSVSPQAFGQLSQSGQSSQASQSGQGSQSAQANQPSPAVEMAALRKDGREVPVEATFSSWRSGQETFYTAILRDITDRQRTQEALQEAARLDATATLAGGIANQFNNLLFGVLGNTELLQMRLADRPDVTGRLEMISQQAQRASELVQQMLAFARRGQYQPVVVNLNDTVRKTVQSTQVRDGIDVDFETDSSLWRISADPTQLAQLMANLLANAAEALDQRADGRVSISTRNVVIDERRGDERRADSRRTTDVPELEPGPYVCLEVTDNGTGMSPEVLAKIYTPFFTTKFQGRGLGMAAVWGIVRHHGGHIDIDSEVDQGTKIHLYLPAIDSEMRMSSAPERRMPVPGGTETVLVVDEEEVFISVTREFLEMLGYRVLEASTGSEAVELAEKHAGGIDLALLDTNLTSMNPVSTYAQLVAARPEIRIILCSSDADQTATSLLEAGASAFLRKPFGLDLMGLEIRRALDG